MPSQLPNKIERFFPVFDRVIFFLNNLNRVINLLIITLVRNRISTLSLFRTDLASLGPYYQDLGSMLFSLCNTRSEKILDLPH